MPAKGGAGGAPTAGCQLFQDFFEDRKTGKTTRVHSLTPCEQGPTSAELRDALPDESEDVIQWLAQLGEVEHRQTPAGAGQRMDFVMLTSQHIALMNGDRNQGSGEARLTGFMTQNSPPFRRAVQVEEQGLYVSVR